MAATIRRRLRRRNPGVRMAAGGFYLARMLHYNVRRRRHEDPTMVRKRIMALAALLVALSPAPPAGAQDKLPVVATFSILGDLVRQVGGDRVDVVTLVGPGGDAHVYAPAPADGRTLAQAKLVFSNGLGFEGWIDRLVKASGTKALPVVASKGVRPRQAADEHDKVDPHAWQSIANAKIYVGNIRDALGRADPGGEPVYRQNAAAYLAQLDALEADVKAAIAAIPPERHKIITTHDAFGYFGAAYSMEFIAPQGVSTDSEASARDVARIITQIRRQKIPAVFLENVSDPRLLQRIAAESGAKVGGRLFSDSLSVPGGPAPSYVAMMRHNIGQLAAALTP
jgi:zinc/manganese transport system substrate-binding protein